MLKNHTSKIAAAAIALAVAAPIVTVTSMVSADESETQAVDMTNWQPVEQLITVVKEAGFETILEFEMEDGVYEFEVADAAGKEVELIVDPVTGAITLEEDDD